MKEREKSNTRHWGIDPSCRDPAINTCSLLLHKPCNGYKTQQNTPASTPCWRPRDSCSSCPAGAGTVPIGSSGLRSAKLPRILSACPKAGGFQEDTTMSVLKAWRSPAGALLLFLWPWGGRWRGNKSTSSRFECGKECRWLRLTLRGGIWDLGMFLKYYLCLSDKNWVNTECALKQNPLMSASRVKESSKVPNKN